MGGIFSKFREIFLSDDNYENEDEEKNDVDVEAEDSEEEDTQEQTQESMNKTVPLSVVQKSHPDRMELLNFTMQNYEMTEEISRYIKNRKPIIVNMEKLESHEKIRAFDFLAGACVVLNGDVEKVTEDIFIFAPEHVRINTDNIKSKSKSGFLRN